MSIPNFSQQITALDLDFDQNTDLSIQANLAFVLRKQAIEHLQSSQEVVAKNFRGEYVAADLGFYKDFLSEQEKEGAWGTYLEATALGELYQCNVVVTPVKTSGAKEVFDKPICLYRAYDDNAPTVHLFNKDNVHWYVNNNTKPDGNCLFNAFAQDFRKIMRNQGALHKLDQIPTGAEVSNLYRFFNEHEVIKHQRLIEQSIAASPAPNELKQIFEIESLRISQLSPEERQQIQEDYEFAFKIANADRMANRIQSRL